MATLNPAKVDRMMAITACIRTWRRIEGQGADGHHRLLQRGSYISVEEVGEEHNEEELHGRVDPYISPGHHLCCG